MWFDVARALEEMELQFICVFSVSPRSGPQAGSVAERMHDRNSIRVRQNDGGAADSNTLRIDMLQYLVNNWWCDAEWYLRLLLARSLSTGIHS